jgi:gas vesicle protein
VNEFEKEQKVNSDKLFELIKDLTKKIKTEIEQEKAECQSTHEEVFAYVE